LNQIRIHGTAFKTYRLIKLILTLFGKISVGDNDVKTNTRISRIRSPPFLSLEKYQITTPLMAIINVADSALWLKIIIQINTDDKRSI
jgi:hypothetical protein